MKLKISNQARILKDVMVPMRDGTLLAMDIYLPASRSADNCRSDWPVLLERTPYDKKGLNRSERSQSHPAPSPRPAIAEWFCSKGYAVAMQDCRGRYKSGGTFAKYLHEAEDGFDTMDWITQQDWCNGKIGTFGVSYGAHTQIAAACLKPPGLATMFLDSGGFASAYHGGIRRGGAFEMKQVTWALKHALLSPESDADPKRKAALEAVNLIDWMQGLPWSSGSSPLSAAPEYEAYLFKQWQSGRYDDYWRQLGLSVIDRYKDMPDIPVMILNSWYDPYVSTSTANYLGFSKSNHSPVFLTMGPWTHGQRSASYSGDVDFGENAVFEESFGCDYLEYRLAWFDWNLKGIRSPLFDPQEPVQMFVMGGADGKLNNDGRLNHGGYWKKYCEWPANVDGKECYYLDQAGTLALQKPTASKAYLEYSYDPKSPTPTIGGAVTSGEPLAIGGAFDQRERDDFLGCTAHGRDLKHRADTLSFETVPLMEDTLVNGPITATLWVSSDQPDTDFTVKLIDVYPPSEDLPEGFAMNVSDGILRARYRDSWEEPTFMKPGSVYQMEVELYATANLFKKGHKIRVDIASSNFPQFDFNPNTGQEEGVWTTTAVAVNRIHMDANCPSHITLPILK